MELDSLLRIKPGPHCDSESLARLRETIEDKRPPDAIEVSYYLAQLAEMSARRKAKEEETCDD
jgi:hypothetical protein